jgi:hypothetical protein
MSPDSFWYRALDPVADAVNPLLTVLAALVPRLQRTWRGWGPALRHWVAAAAGLAVVYAIRALDGRFDLWASIGGDFSTHTAYAVSLATTVVCWHRRWVWPVLVAVVGYAVIILLVGYHDLLDVASSAVVAAPPAWLICYLLGQRWGGPIGSDVASLRRRG